MKRSSGRWGYVRSIRSGLTLERLTAVMRGRFQWPGFEIATSRGRRVARLDLEHLGVLITELPERTEEYNFQIHLSLSREEGLIGHVLLERWQDLLNDLHEPQRFRQELKFWLRSERQIRPFCGRLRKRFGLPPFEHDAENENEWCISQGKHLVVHVSRAYLYKTYHEWNPAECPRGCNFSVALKIRENAPEGWNVDLGEWVQALSGLGDSRVYHRGKWRKPG